jgi:hypothetical protein
MSVTMCGAGGAGEAGDPIKDGGLGMRSASALVLAMVVDAVGVVGTELEDELVSGAGCFATS